MSLLVVRAGAFCAGILFILASVPAAADEASDLLAKHKSFVGWQLGDGAIRTLRYEQTTSSLKDGVLDTEQVIKVGAVYRANHTSKKGYTSSDGFTGRLFWLTNQNGFIRPTLGDEQKFAIARDVLHNEGTSAMAGVSKGSKTVDGVSYPVIRVSTPGDDIDLYVDPATGAYKRAVLDPGGDYETVLDILEYADAAPGKKVISKYKVDGSDYVYTRAKFVANAPVTDDELHPPVQTALWNFASTQPFPIKVTDKRVYVDAKVNGVLGHFIMDTGAASIVLSDDFAARAHVKHEYPSYASGIGGASKTQISKAGSIEIGGNTLSNVVVSSISQKIDQEAPDGLIGFDLFGGAIVGVDTDRQQMTISDPHASAADKSAGVPVIVDLSTGTPKFPMKLNGNIDVNATLDSGNFYYVLFSPDLISHHGLRMLIDNSVQGYLSSHVGMRGVGGVEVDGCGQLDTLSLGPIVYQGAPGCTSGSFSGREALLGFDFFRNFNYIFDYPEATIVFIPHKA